jgi:hypothetical protein
MVCRTSRELCADFRAEFRCANLGFDEHTTHGRIDDWRLAFGRNIRICGKGGDSSSLAATLYLRGSFALLMCGVFVWSWHEHLRERPDGSDSNLEPEPGYTFSYWWIYLTRLTLTLQCTYHVLAVLVAVRGRGSDGDGGCCLDPSPGTKVPCLSKLVWLLQAVCLPSTFFVFVLYWGLVFDGTFHLLSAFTHGVNFFVMMADAWTSGFPMLLAHAVYFVIYALLYLGWTLVHYKAGLTNEHGDPYIYSALDCKYDRAA